MSIPSRRQEILDGENNVATSEFQNQTDSGVYNSPNLEEKSLSPEGQAVIETDTQSETITFEKIKDTTTRAAKDAMGKVRDISKLSGKDIDGIIGGMLPNNPQAQSLFNKLADKCKSRGLGSGNIGKPFDKNMSCGSGQKRQSGRPGCNTSEYANVINKLTNGQYQSNYFDLNKALANLVGLSKFGYDMNMCGVFSALSNNLDPAVLSRASGALLGYVGGAGNVLGFLDLSKSQPGLHALRENPSGLNSVFTNFKLPKETRERDLVGLSQQVDAGAQLYDDGYNVSYHDGVSSVAYSDGYNPDLDKMYQAHASNNSVSADNPDAVPDNAVIYSAAAYSSGRIETNDFEFA